MSVADFVGQQCLGSVKGFSNSGGYGFLSGDDFPEDVFVNFKLAPTLRDAEQLGVSIKGSRISFVPQENPAKPGSYEATNVALDDGMPLPEESEDLGSGAASYLGRWVHGHIKSFNVQKGWGFLTSRSFEEDVFVNFKLAPNLQAAAHGASLSGQLVTFLLQDGKTPGSYEAGAVRLKGACVGKGKPAVAIARPSAVANWSKPTAYNPHSYGKGKGFAQTGYVNYGGKGSQKGCKGGKSAAAFVGRRVAGHIKSFNVEKGWGFLRCDHFEDDLFVSYKLAPNIPRKGPFEGVAASFVVSPGQKPGSFEATDVHLEYDSFNYGAWGPMKGASYGPAKGAWKSAAAGRGPYGQKGKGCSQKGKGCSGMKTTVAEEGMGFIGLSVEGHIKSFSLQSAWGFASSDSFSDDCFFSVRTNPHLDHASIVKGARIQFTVQASKSREGALEAIDIVPIESEMLESEEPAFG